MLTAQRRANLKRHPDRKRRGNESYMLAVAAYSDFSTPTTSSPISPFRGEHSNVAGGRAVASRRPSSAPIAPTRSPLVRDSGRAAFIRQENTPAPFEGQQGMKFSRRRREDTAHRRRVLMGIAQPGDDLATDPITLEDENQRLKVELNRAAEDRRKSRAQRMRLESELLRAEGKVETLLVELKYAPRNRNTSRLNAVRRDAEKCGVIRMLARQNSELQELLSRQENEMKVLKRTQEWSTVTEMTAAMEEYVVEIQRLYRLFAQYDGTADVQGVPTRNTGNGTRSKLDLNECVDVADLGQSNVPRRTNKNQRMERDGSDQNTGRFRRRVSCCANGNVWRFRSRVTAEPTAVEMSRNHRDASRVVVDENEPAVVDEVERSQLPVGGINNSIRGSGTLHTQVPGQNQGRITNARNGFSLHLTKKFARSAVCTSPVCLSRPSSYLDGSDGGVEETPTTSILRSQVSRQIALSIPRRGRLRSKRRGNRPLSAPPKERRQSSALLHDRHQAPRVCYSSHPQHVKNLKARISTARRRQSSIVPEIQTVETNPATSVDAAIVHFGQVEGQGTPARTLNTAATATTSNTEHEQKRRKGRLKKTGSNDEDWEPESCSEALPQEEDPLLQECEPYNNDNLMVVPRCDDYMNGEARSEEEPAKGGQGTTNGVEALAMAIDPSSKSNSLSEKQTSGLVSPTAASSGSDKQSTLSDGDSESVTRHEERPEPDSSKEGSSAGGSTPKSSKNSTHDINVDDSALMESECQAGDIEECHGTGVIPPTSDSETYSLKESETGTAEYGDDFDEDEEQSQTIFRG